MLKMLVTTPGLFKSPLKSLYLHPSISLYLLLYFISQLSTSLRKTETSESGKGSYL